MSETETEVGFFPSDKKRIERIEKTLGHFIAWSQIHLGEQATKELLEMLHGDGNGPETGDKDE